MMRLALLSAAALVVWLPQSAGRPLYHAIAQSTDATWLERLCIDRTYAESEYAQRGRNTAGVKGNRSAAYMQLAVLGTPDSLAAIARIEKAMHHRSVLPEPATPGAPLYHPASHVSDSHWRPDAQTRLADGREIAAYTLDFYGPPALFLAVRSGDAWSRPMLALSGLPDSEPPKITFAALTGGRVRLEFAAANRRGLLPGFAPTPDAIELALDELARDTDGDGWTDITERYLQLNWRDPDSDRDGIPDGEDAAPSLREPARQDEEDARILRRAIFAMFGLTESPGALFVADSSRRLQLDGLPGPVFYREGNGGVRVTWKISSKTADTATVRLTDFEGALSGSSNDALLKKIQGDWYVVGIKMISIS